MSILRQLNASRINIAWSARLVWIAVGLMFLAGPVNSFAQSLNCTLIVPPNPLSATGLATPYQLTATNFGGRCDQANANSSAFVQGVFIDPNSGQIAVYNPLVINRGTPPGVAPTPPDLPQGAIVSLYFGFNGNNLSLQFQQQGDGTRAQCVQGFGQEAWCNTAAFFQAANAAIADGRLQVPSLGTGHDGLPCPTTRSFRLVDQDQSDNVTTKYVRLGNGLFASSTASNRAAPGATILSNPSDNGLLSGFVDAALGCTPWLVPDVQDGGAMVPSLPTNELLARAKQAAPVALVPLGDPFTLSPPFTGAPSLTRVNTFRSNVDQPQANGSSDASTAAYCSQLSTVHTNDMLIRDRSFLVGFASPMPDVANNLYTFMAQRYVGSYQMLGCAALLGKPVNVTLTTDGNGVVIDARVGNAAPTPANQFTFSVYTISPNPSQVGTSTKVGMMYTDTGTGNNGQTFTLAFQVVSPSGAVVATHSASVVMSTGSTHKSSLNFTPSAGGTYTVQGTVRDSSGAVVAQNNNVATFTVQGGGGFRFR